VKEYNIIGVLKNFNFKSLRDNITGVVMELASDNGALSVKVKSTNMKPLLARIESAWNQVSPNQRLEYSFMDQDFDAVYKFEQRTGTIFLSFTIFAIIIACLGLFGLSAYAAEQRNREIGIRKVLGANVSTLVALPSKDFLKLVFISILTAAPLA
jgi:putative ABC transport system permease protein